MIHVTHLEKLKVASFFPFVPLFCAASSGIPPTVIEGCLYMSSGFKACRQGRMIS